MKKSFYLLLSFCAVICLFVACNTQRRTTDVAIICPTALYDEGVVINGVRWATRNVDAPGTFASFPTSIGMFYSIAGRSGLWWEAWTIQASGNLFPLPNIGIEIDCPIGPCPSGWRLPTDDEFRLLIDAGSEVVRINGIYGRLFGMYPNQIFLPAAGFMNQSFEGREGSYWSRCNRNDRPRQVLSFSTVSDFIAVRETLGSNIRCVAK